MKTCIVVRIDKTLNDVATSTLAVFSSYGQDRTIVFDTEADAADYIRNRQSFEMIEVASMRVTIRDEEAKRLFGDSLHDAFDMRDGEEDILDVWRDYVSTVRNYKIETQSFSPRQMHYETVSYEEVKYKEERKRKEMLDDEEREFTDPW